MLVQCVCQKYSLSKRLQSFSLCLLKPHGTQRPTVRKWDQDNGVNVITVNCLVQQLEKIFHQTVEEQWFFWSKMVKIGFCLKHLESMLWSSLKKLPQEMHFCENKVISHWSYSLSPGWGGNADICLAVSVGLFQSQ